MIGSTWIDRVLSRHALSRAMTRRMPGSCLALGRPRLGRVNASLSKPNQMSRAQGDYMYGTQGILESGRPTAHSDIPFLSILLLRSPIDWLVKSYIGIVYLFIRGPCQYESFVLCTSDLYPVRATSLVMCTQHIYQHPYPER